MVKLNSFVENFGYKIMESLPLEEGIKFILDKKCRKAFDRKTIMAELASISPKCVCCNLVATKFCLGKDKGNSLHWDLYSEDDKAFSLDHIIPKANGGRNIKANAQILCLKCNALKADKPERIIGYKLLLETGLDVQLIMKHNPFIRIGYWQKLSDEILINIKNYFHEEAIYDEDCGWLYTYYFKH